MSLVAVAAPQSESELACMLSLLEADGIPAFVQNGRFGGLLPGPQIDLYNARRIMVPEACADRARAALAVLATPADEPLAPTQSSLRDKLRVMLEFLLFQWFFPGSRWHKRTRVDTKSRSA